MAMDIAKDTALVAADTVETTDVANINNYQQTTINNAVLRGS